MGGSSLSQVLHREPAALKTVWKVFRKTPTAEGNFSSVRSVESAILQKLYFVACTYPSVPKIFQNSYFSDGRWITISQYGENVMVM